MHHRGVAPLVPRGAATTSAFDPGDAMAAASTRADVAVGAAPVAVSPLLEIVRFRKADDEPLTRRVYLGENGGPVGDGSACRMWANFSGSARRGSAIMRRSTANPSGVKKRQGSRIPGAASESGARRVMAWATPLAEDPCRRAAGSSVGLACGPASAAVLSARRDRPAR